MSRLRETHPGRYRLLVLSLSILILAFFLAPQARQAFLASHCSPFVENPVCLSGCCRGSSGVWRLNSCTWTPFGYCTEDWNTSYIVTCTDPAGTCLTEWWDQGHCQYFATRCQRNTFNAQSNCCIAAPATTATPESCTPTYAPPNFGFGAITPERPLTYGQDPDRRGLAVTIWTTGGMKDNGCPDGPHQAHITALNLQEVRLSSSTITWITGELALRYPGARILDRYPLTPYAPVTYNGTVATLSSHFDPLDPGSYELHLRITQSDGQVYTRILTLPVYLFESALVE